MSVSDTDKYNKSILYRRKLVTMELSVLKSVLEFYLNSGNCSESEFESINRTLNDCNELLDLDYEPDDTVQIVPDLTVMDLLNISTYDEFGKLLKQNPETTVDEYRQICTDLFTTELSTTTVESGFYFIRDLWNDNERYNSNNPDGTFNRR
jgi:hypothetical protein